MELNFHGELAIIDPQIYVIVEPFVVENTALLSGRRVIFLA